MLEARDAVRSAATRACSARAAFTARRRSAIARWQEEWHFGADMVEEALLHAENCRTVRYVNGILRSWH
ncbi:DnaD domain protein, partial [uncultured Microbacterium sp.]|uniref:DnaD domain protein n=1 Tax=uncultured Microbacterium sp. TaxID=191216 RepID=UPI00262DB3E9